MVFVWSWPSLCSRDRQYMLDQNPEMTLLSHILGSLWHFREKHRMQFCMDSPCFCQKPFRS
jgi:hypothetical protein